MNRPMANAESIQIGTVEFVSADEIKVLLDLETPHDAALNPGVPRPCPRINSYVLVAGEGGFLVSQIEWITIERSYFPKRRVMQDFVVIDHPYPLRKMSVVPLGILREDIDEGDKSTKYKFSRGIEIFPTVGDPVLIPTQNQLKAIVESGSNRRVDIGISPLAGDAVVSVDPDRLFGRHLAVLGNTGSGKSCSVAGLIRWSIESAQKHKTSESTPNTRFIILDPKGEYRKSFKDMNNVRIYGAEKNDDKGIRQLKVPIWLWNCDELASFVQASDKTQKPTLVQALRSVRGNNGGSADDMLPIDPDIPRPFLGERLIRIIKANAEIMNTSPHIETMLLRIKTLLADAKLKPVISPSEEITLENWLDDYICPSDKTNGSITVIDLSLLPAEAIHIITSVIARVTLEALQRYRRMNNAPPLPTVLVMEEAHTFIKKYSDKEDEKTVSMCVRVFEKIAREGKKCGLGLVLSSPHPSELSSSVISQCNSFLLHRLSNDSDQELVGKLAPDNSRGLLRELPSLPSRNAVLLGWASELPVMVRMNYLGEKYRPESYAPEFWNVWTGEERLVKWKNIAEEWQK